MNYSKVCFWCNKLIQFLDKCNIFHNLHTEKAIILLCDKNLKISNKNISVTALLTLVILNISSGFAQINGSSFSCLGDVKRYTTSKSGYKNWQVSGGNIVKNYSDSIDVEWISISNTFVKFKSLNEGTGLYDSSVVHVNVYPKIKPNVFGLKAVCVGGNYQYVYKFPSAEYKPNWQAINGILLSQTNADTALINWNTPGMGKIIISNTNNEICSTPDTINIAVITIPDMSIFGISKLCKGEMDIFSVDYADNYSYSWKSGSGKIFGDTNLFQAGIYWDNPGSDTISVTVVNNQSGCSRTFYKYVNIYEIPKVQLKKFDNICVSGDNIKLTGGTPEGGTYAGGYYVRDGYFNVAFAGVGKHLIVYSWRAPNGICTGSDTAYINVLPVPQVPKIYYENNILYTNINSGIQWYYNGIRIDEGNKKTLKPFATGYYSLTAKNAEGCFSEMSDSIYVSMSGVDAADSNSQYQLSTINGIIHLKCKSEVASVKIYNLLGNCEYEARPLTDNFDINIKLMKNAVYLIQLIFNNGESITVKYIS